MAYSKATDEEIIDRVNECYAAGETIDGGGVLPETVASTLPIRPKTAAKRLADLADAGEIKRDYGLDGRFNHRTGFAPADDDETEEPRLIADGGTTNYGPAEGTLIRVDHGDRKTWHHSVSFDGYEHETACGQVLTCDRFDELRREIADWDDLESTACCDECAGSVRSMAGEVQ